MVIPTLTLLDRAIERIRGIPDSAVRDAYYRALKSSVVWEGVEDGKLPTSAEDIVAIVGVDASVLKDNLILLSKRDVAEYAHELGSSKTLASIRKGLTESTYQRQFGRDRCVVRNARMLLMGYAEARMYLGVRTRGQVPKL